MNIKKVLLTLLLMHIIAFALTACGKKDNKSVMACPINMVLDMYGNCVNGVPGYPGYPGQPGVNPNAPFIKNGNISIAGAFYKMLLTEFGRYSNCDDFGGVNCNALQFTIQNVNGNTFNVVIRGLAINPGHNIYFGNSYGNYHLQNIASGSVSFYATPQTRTINGKTVVILNQSTINPYNPFNHAPYEHTRGQLALVTDGLLSNERLGVQLIYTKSVEQKDANGKKRQVPVQVSVANGSLVKGRDY